MLCTVPDSETLLYWSDGSSGTEMAPSVNTMFTDVLQTTEAIESLAWSNPFL